MSSSSSSPLTPVQTRMSMWRPWSAPIQLPVMRRKLCGLLNKIDSTNLDAVSHSISHIAVAVERGGDPHILDVFVRSIFQHAVSDSLRTSVYVDLCQKIVDELEAERSQWRKVDLFHLGNPMDCFETSLRLRTQYEFDRIMFAEDMEELRVFASFVGELLAEGLLFAQDTITMVDMLFDHASRNAEGPTAALDRLLSPVIASFNASQLLVALDIVERAEALLVQDGLAPRVRYTFMNIHDSALYPRPQDAFSSVHHRSDVYGLDISGPNSETASVAECQDETHEATSHIHLQQAQRLLLEREDSAAVGYLKTLDTEGHQSFISVVVSAALATGDLSDAQLVASFFSHRGVRELCDTITFARGFEQPLALLEDTIIDIPQAARLLAVMLQGSPLPASTVENLAISSAARTSSSEHTVPVAERLLETYSALIQSPGSRSGFTSSAASTEDLHDADNERSDSERLSFGYAF
ncbi:hypothetical protein EIP91_003910 [Steccherinum ochraceum]|uniref:MI domain-containing protein n=1 Tax=Steccherinum ochraceum TaxID=92696 RepID=A0A4R0RCY7_9APHY|nr:hypothetical protein EIP91_003910 [Steccherinum ochraceum]